MIKSIFVAALLVFSTSSPARGLLDDPATKLTDGTIAKALLTIDHSEMEAAVIAKQRAIDPKAKAYADLMLEEHAKEAVELKKISEQNNFALEDSELSLALKEDGKEMLAKLEAVTSVHFDKAYLESQVKAHTKALALVSDTLLPQAGLAELKLLLEKSKAHIADHLEKAKAVQVDLLK